jgi:hypothetical protein
VGSCVDLTKVSLKVTLNVIGSGVKTTTSLASTGIEMVQNSLNRMFDWEKEFLKSAGMRTEVMAKAAGDKVEYYSEKTKERLNIPKYPLDVLKGKQAIHERAVKLAQDVSEIIDKEPKPSEKEKRREYYQKVAVSLETELERFKKDVDILTALPVAVEKEKLLALERYLESNIAKLKLIKEHLLAGEYVRKVDEELAKIKTDLIQVIGVPISNEPKSSTVQGVMTQQGETPKKKGTSPRDKKDEQQSESQILTHN